MNSLPGETEAAEHLKQTALRDFGPSPEDDGGRGGPGYKLMVSPNDTPVPALLKYALALIGLEAGGPGEKVAWWVNFSYRGELCELSHEKFGVRLRLRTEASEDEAGRTLAQIMNTSD